MTPISSEDAALLPAEELREAVRLVSDAMESHSDICRECGGRLPNPDCGHMKNGVTPCCNPVTPDPAEIVRIVAEHLTRHPAASPDDRKPNSYAGEIGGLKSALNKAQRANEPAEATIKELAGALVAAKEKLAIYRRDREGKRGGEYSGGMEYTALIKTIDAALAKGKP